MIRLWKLRVFRNKPKEQNREIIVIGSFYLSQEDTTVDEGEDDNFNK